MAARSFEWSDLEIFLATARGGTLAAGAGALGLDASTVQRRIGKLEAALRTRLFERSQRGYALTAAGEELYQHALGMEEHLVTARRRVVGRDATLEGSVRVATVDDLAVVVLSPIVRTFRDAHPNVTVCVDVRESFADLAKQQADVAIRFGAKPPDGDVVAKLVARVGVGLYASRAYLSEHGRPKRLEDLREHVIVRGEEGAGGMPMEREMSRWADPAKTAFRSRSLFARLGAIRAGVGIGFLGCFMGEREKDLVRLPFAFPDAASNLWLLVHVDLRRNARVRAFVEHTYAALVAERSTFEGP